MKNFVSAQNRMRLRDLDETLRITKRAIEGMRTLKEREQNPEKVMMLEEQIQQKCGIVVSLENQIALLEGKRK